jgi:transcriptional regulator with XRE-family HTH domain
MNIAKEIRRIRKELKLSQGALAKIIRRDRSTITHYERGDAVPPGDILIKILEMGKRKGEHE